VNRYRADYDDRVVSQGGGVGYWLGVDLGTTFVAAARFDPSGVEVVTLGDRSVVMPSAVYAGADGAVAVGEAAERRAVSSPERVARQFKRRLGDPTPLRLGEASYSPTELLALVLGDVLARVSQLEGESPERVVLTHPANWGPFRRGVFKDVPGLAGVADAVMLTEPEAAATYYAAAQQLAIGATVAVYDLGGGTFDATVVRQEPGGLRVLGTPEGVERLGGIDFDQALFDFVSYSADGALEELDARDPKTGIALARLRQDCVLAKESLSVDSEVLLPVFLPERQFDVRLTREGFEDLIRGQLETSITALSRTLGSAGVTADELSAVLLVGGSSRIPLVAQMVSNELGRPILLDTHPKYAVALGAAFHPAVRPPEQQPASQALAGHSTLVWPAGQHPVPPATPTPPMPASPPAPTAPWSERGAEWFRRLLAGDRRALITAALVVALLVAGGIFFTHNRTDRTVVLLGIDQPGDDPFGPNLVVGGSVTPTAQLDPAAGDQPTGDRDGLYFDTIGAASCERGALNTLLGNDPTRAGAWSGAINAGDDAADYLATLSPMRLRSDTRVTAFSYSGGEAAPHPAVLQAGTAVLVDNRGLPAVDCANSDPLAEASSPPSVSDLSNSDTTWAGYNPMHLTEIHPAGALIREFGLVNLAGAAPFRRPSGSDGTHDIAQLPTTGLLDGSYSFTGAMTHCDGYSSCRQDNNATFTMHATFSGCSTNCTMHTDGLQAQGGGGGVWITAGNYQLVRVGDTPQYSTVNGSATGTCYSTLSNGTKIPKGQTKGTWQLSVTVTNSALVSGGVWNATQLKIDEEGTLAAAAGICPVSTNAISLTGTAQ
jgi:actin-like ATPase involved in cell morphogenesis